MENLLKPLKISNNFFCNNCNYKCCKKSEWLKHTLTQKHIRLIATNLDEVKNIQFLCECNKKYKHMSSLCKHKKTCSIINNNKDIVIDNNITNIVLEVFKNNNDFQKQYIELQKQNQEFQQKQNQEFQQKLLESFQDICKNGIITNNNNNTITNTNTNSNNKTFNLNFFLNETCKNAMNITDFVDSIKLQLSDLESVGRIGYIEGLSKIIIKNLNALDVTERPVHCSDPKRDTMYVKDDNKWDKESEENPTVLKAIEDIANKNTKQVKEWKIKNPECASSKSCKADQYSHIVIEVVCSNNDANNKKVLKKLAKEVALDKS